MLDLWHDEYKSIIDSVQHKAEVELSSRRIYKNPGFLEWIVIMQSRFRMNMRFTVVVDWKRELKVEWMQLHSGLNSASVSSIQIYTVWHWIYSLFLQCLQSQSVCFQKPRK
jgi:hypothetical protein